MRARILIYIAAAVTAVSCESEKALNTGEIHDNVLKVRHILPELEISTKSTGNTILAYIPDSLKENKVQPIQHSWTKDDACYYIIPENATSVFFSNITSTEDENVKFSREESGSPIIVLKDSTRAYFSDDILAGGITGVSPGNPSPYQVNINRLSSSVTAKLLMTDSNGTPLENTSEIIASAELKIDSLGTFIRIKDDMTMEAGGYVPLRTVISQQEAEMVSPTYNIIPGKERLLCTLDITYQDGKVKSYSKELGQLLEPNRNYVVTFKLKSINGGLNFTLTDANLSTYSSSNTIYEQELFSVEGPKTVGMEAGDSTNLIITPAMKGDWSYEMLKGSEFFSIRQSEDTLTLKALSQNPDESRLAVVRLTYNSDKYIDVHVSQRNASQQTITVTKGNSNYFSFSVKGSNISISGASLTDTYEGQDSYSLSFSNSKFGNGSTLTITGDAIETFNVNDYSSSYRNRFSFDNCVSLASLGICSSDDIIDVSGLPALSTLDLEYSAATSLVFAEGQNITELNCRYCTGITDLDLRNISSTLKILDCSQCSKLSSFTIYPSGFTGERILEEAYFDNCDGLLGMSLVNFTKLKKIDIDNCQGMGTINLSGCSSLYNVKISYNSAVYLNVSNCPALTDINLGNMSLDEIRHDGSPVETLVSLGSLTIRNLDFSGKTTLKKISGNLNCPVFNTSGCTSLDLVDSNIYQLSSLNVEGCSSLTRLRAIFDSNATEHTVNIANIPAIKSVYFNYLHTPVDYSLIPSVKEIAYDNSSKVTEMDMSVCPNLERIIIYNSKDLNTVSLPGSATYLDLQQSYIGSINVSGLTKLQDVQMLTVHYVTSLDFSGCTSLKNVTLKTNPELESVNLAGNNTLSSCIIYNNSKLGNADLSGCASLATCEIYNNSKMASANLNGCTALTECNIYNNSYLGSINLQNCSSLTDFNTDVKNCNNTSLYAIDLTGCTSLKNFRSTNGLLTSMDFSSCLGLQNIDLRKNSMETAALDTMLGTICDRTEETVTGILYIAGNPGADSCNKNLVMDKNWYFSNETL